MLRQVWRLVRRFNICKDNLRETRQLCQAMLEQVFVPALRKPSEGFDQMSRSLIQGMWSMVPFLDYDAFLSFTMRLAGVETTESKNKSPQSFHSRALLAYQIFVHEVVLRNWFLGSIWRPILNFGMWLSVFLTQRLPILAYIQYGRSNVYWLALKRDGSHIRRAIRHHAPRVDVHGAVKKYSSSWTFEYWERRARLCYAILWL